MGEVRTLPTTETSINVSKRLNSSRLRWKIMNDSDQFKAQIDAIEQQTLRIFSELAEKTSQFELPKLPQAVDEYRQKLEENTYNVLVVGEAKRGKSSFVNALIGKDLLPTDVDIATNQIFRVSYAEQEAYRLRFEDE